MKRSLDLREIKERRRAAMNVMSLYIHVHVLAARRKKKRSGSLGWAEWLAVLGAWALGQFSLVLARKE